MARCLPATACRFVRLRSRLKDPARYAALPSGDGESFCEDDDNSPASVDTFEPKLDVLPSGDGDDDDVMARLSAGLVLSPRRHGDGRPAVPPPRYLKEGAPGVVGAAGDRERERAVRFPSWPWKLWWPSAAASTDYGSGPRRPRAL